MYGGRGWAVCALHSLVLLVRVQQLSNGAREAEVPEDGFCFEVTSTWSNSGYHAEVLRLAPKVDQLHLSLQEQASRQK